MKYLVLGSAGQIGSAFVKKIKKEHKNDSIIEFDIETSPKEDLRIYHNELLDKAVKECDFVFFFAFDVGGSRYLKTYQNTFDFISNNTKIINNTFDIIKKHNKPFIFASSQMANMSFSGYGRLKAVGESYTNALAGLVVKFWNVYGIEHDLNKSHVITDLIIKAKNTKTINLLTDGTEERQFLYADDCCECLLEIVKRYKDIPRYKELHVTNFEWSSVLDVAEIIASHYPGSKIIPSTSGDDFQKNKKNEPDPYILEFWKPKTNLKTGISKIVSVMEKEAEHFFGKNKK